MDSSKFLSKVIGIYLVIISCAMFVNMPQFIGNIVELIKNPSIMFVAGFIALILGVIMVVSHNVWEWSWRVVVTIISWGILFKGISIVIYPQFIDHASLVFVHNLKYAYMTCGLDFILGVLLCYFGFRR